MPATSRGSRRAAFGRVSQRAYCAKLQIAWLRCTQRNLCMSRSLEDQFATWIGMWQEQIAHVDDVALAVENLFAQGLDLVNFGTMPAIVRQQVLHDLDTFALDGVRTYVIAKTGTEVDDSEQMYVVAAKFRAAGIWSVETSKRLGAPDCKWGQ